ncbi:MAG: nuclear transport factor 2 family protein [bacterium]|nr:nuclear transport factor 2 family protein [bacterium]
MRKISILFSLLFLFYVYCESPDTAELDRSEILKVLEDQAEAWNKKDIETYMEGYWKSDELTFVSGGNIRKGWDAVFKSYKERYSPEMMGILTFDNLKINFLSGEAAYVSGTWDLKREPDNPGGRFTLIFRKLPAGWRIVYDHTSSKEKN